MRLTLIDPTTVLSQATLARQWVPLKMVKSALEVSTATLLERLDAGKIERTVVLDSLREMRERIGDLTGAAFTDAALPHERPELVELLSAWLADLDGLIGWVAEEES